MGFQPPSSAPHAFPGSGPDSPFLDGAFVATALGVSPPATPLSFQFVTSDSRKAAPGGLFVAIRGEKLDGHAFVPQAVQAGCTAVLVKRGTAVPPGSWAIEVDDTEAAYRKLAAAWRKTFHLPVVCVAGSVGKTSTKELLAAILSGRYPSVLKTQGSQNGFLGIPMTLLELRASHGAAVVEVGIDDVGAMAQHWAVVAPTVSLLTAVGPEHLEKLRDVPTVAREESLALTLTSEAGGQICVNRDDPWIAPHSLLKGAKTFALDQDADVKGTLTPEGTLQVRLEDGSTFDLQPPLPGRHNARNLLAAVCVAGTLGLTGLEIQRGLATFSGTQGRSELRVLPSGTRVLCDYYNSNPSSLEAGLELLAATPSRGSRIACLADMLELGTEEERFHRSVAPWLTRSRVTHVFLYGERMRWLADELTKTGFTGTVMHFSTHGELAEALCQAARPGDAILIKGSRGMKMELAYQAAEPRLSGATGG